MKGLVAIGSRMPWAAGRWVVKPIAAAEHGLVRETKRQPQLGARKLFLSIRTSPAADARAGLSGVTTPRSMIRVSRKEALLEGTTKRPWFRSLSHKVRVEIGQEIVVSIKGVISS